MIFDYIFIPRSCKKSTTRLQKSVESWRSNAGFWRNGWKKLDVSIREKSSIFFSQNYSLGDKSVNAFILSSHAYKSRSWRYTGISWSALHDAYDAQRCWWVCNAKSGWNRFNRKFIFIFISVSIVHVRKKWKLFKIRIFFFLETNRKKSSYRSSASS